MRYQVTRLESGLTVATAALPQMVSLSLGVWVGVGGRFEPPALCGASHFIEHLLFKGTRRRSAKAISQAIEGRGGTLNAFTSEEHTCFFAKARHDHFAEVLDVLQDMFLHSRFDPDEIDKERAVIKEELAMYLDEPQHQVQELLNTLQWPDQPLGRSITGTLATLDALQRPDLVEYRRTHYLANNTLIAAAGPIPHRQVVRAVARLESRFVQGARPGFEPARSGQTAPRVGLISKPIEQTQLALGIRTCSRHDPRRYALRLLNVLLGENASSRLFQIIREERGLSYAIGSSLSFFEDAGDLVVSAGLDTDHLMPALRLIIGELRRLTLKAPTPRELRRALDYVLGQMDLGLEGTENQMLWLGEQWLGYGKLVSLDAMRQRFRQIQPAEVQAVARDFFQPDRLTLALVGPRKSTAGLGPLLRQVRA